MSTFLVFPIIPWGFLWQRPQQLLTQLGERGHLVLYLAPHEALSVAGEGPKVSIISKNVFHVEISIPGSIGTNGDALTDLQISVMQEALSALLSGATKEELVYLVHAPTWLSAVSRLKATHPGTILYDCMDCHAGFPGAPVEVSSKEQELLEIADLVSATSSRLLDHCSSVHRGAKLLRNAVDLESFTAGSFHPVIEKGPDDVVIGYCGSIAEWIDTKSIVKAAIDNPGWRFVLAGTCTEEQKTHLLGVDNIEYLGVLPYSDIPSLINQFDVALIPFISTPLTDATNPVKLYEYFALGKPVVGFSTPELEQYNQELYLAETPSGFVDAIKAALQEVRERDDSLLERRKQIARNNSWFKRVDQLEAILADHLPINVPRRTFTQKLCSKLYWDERARSEREWSKVFKKQDKEWREERDRVAKDYQAEICRISNERDELLRQQDAEWRKERDRVAQDYQEELRKLSAERDRILAQQDNEWREELNRVIRDYKNEVARLSDERDRKVSLQELELREERHGLVKTHHEEIAQIRRERSSALAGQGYWYQQLNLAERSAELMNESLQSQLSDLQAKIDVLIRGLTLKNGHLKA